MPKDPQDWCLALNALVNAIYYYTREDDPDWQCVQTMQAQKGREAMEHAARILGLGLIKRPFNREELDLIFDWEREI
jgi:hypothetical protein